MKPWSFGGFGQLPPAAFALAAMSSTAARLSQDRHSSTSVDLRASATGLLVKPWKKGSVSSIT